MKRFEYEFESEAPVTLTIDYALDYDEVLKVDKLGEEAFISGNREGLLTLARLLVKLALGDYPAGYHVHLNEDFDADKPKALCVAIQSDGGDDTQNCQ